MTQLNYYVIRNMTDTLPVVMAGFQWAMDAEHYARYWNGYARKYADGKGVDYEVVPVTDYRG